jgi:glyoxylase-like metal-dependent hydrolase (beta-lactamase superfamily II)
MPFGKRGGWREVGRDVFVRNYATFDENVGLVLGDGAALVVDTRSSHVQGAEVLRHVREVTPIRPTVVVNTHCHFDHCYGNAVMLPCEIWAHEACALELRAHGEERRRDLLASLPPAMAREVETVEIVPPDHEVRDHRTIRVGGRSIELRHLGRGHTDGDLVILVADAHVLFAGDLLEEGAPPSFGDAFPLDWPATATHVAALASGPIVPGHGKVVDRAYAERQAAELAAVAAGARAAHAQGIPEEQAAPLLALPPAYAREAIRRAYAQLDGAI